MGMVGFAVWCAISLGHFVLNMVETTSSGHSWAWHGLGCRELSRPLSAGYQIFKRIADAQEHEIGARRCI